MAIPTQHHIVILGSGFAGLRTAIELKKRASRLKQARITLVDARADHVYTPLLYEVCTGSLMPGICADDLRVRELKKGVTFPLSDFCFSGKKISVEVKQGKVLRADPTTHTVNFEDGSSLSYDTLVVALGSQIATNKIPGVIDFALPMKRLEYAVVLQHTFREGLKRARRDGKSWRLVVCGAGATGCELAAELAGYIRSVSRHKHEDAPKVDIVLVDASQRVLSASRESVSRRAFARLSSLGIEMVLNACVKEVRKGEVHIDVNGNKRTLTCDAIVWTAGIEPSTELAHLGCPFDERGFIRVKPTLEVEQTEQVYALGDAVIFLHPKTGARVPALAQVADRQANIVAENITRSLERRPDINWNPPERWTTVIPLGGSFALLDLGLFIIGGRAGYCVHKVIDLWYVLSILPVRRAWKHWSYARKMFLQNDD